MKVRSPLCPKRRAMRLQRRLRHAKKREESRGRARRQDVRVAEGVAKSCGGPEPGAFHIPAKHSQRPCQRTTFGGDSWSQSWRRSAWVGQRSRFCERQMRAYQEIRRRSEGGLRSAGAWHRRQHGGVHQFGHRTETSRSEQTRSRRASKTQATTPVGGALD